MYSYIFVKIKLRCVVWKIKEPLDIVDGRWHKKVHPSVVLGMASGRRITAWVYLSTLYAIDRRKMEIEIFVGSLLFLC